MARSEIKFLKQQGQFNTRIADLVRCNRHTVGRVLGEPTDPARRRRTRPGNLEPPAGRLAELDREGHPRDPNAGGGAADPSPPGQPDLAQITLRLALPRATVERLRARAIREGRNVEGLIAEILASAK